MSSGTYDFNPSMGELVLYAYGLCGIRRPQITTEHMVDARMAANLLLVDYANDGPLLWTVELQTQNLTQGQVTYSVDPSVVMILDAYISQDSGPDRIIMPVSRTEYASFPNKTQQGFPTVFWFDRLVYPTITIWQAPDSSGPYVLKYYTFRQVQDSDYADGNNVEIPYRFLSAFAYGLAAELALSYAPDKMMQLGTIAAAKWQKAAAQDTENVPLHIIPGISSYYR